MTNTNAPALHAHVSTAAADCDGTFGQDYVTSMNDAEIAEHVEANGVNDFSEIHFMQRVLANHCSPYGVTYGMTVKIDETGFEWNESTDEGYRAGEVRWCRDADCDPNLASQFDQYAEMMGY